MSTALSDVSELLGPTTAAGRLMALRDAGLDDAIGLAWVLDRAEELVHAEPVAAEAVLQVCSEAAADDAGLLSVIARADYLRARIRAERGELVTALDHIARARTAWTAAGDSLSALRTDLGRMQVLDDLGRHSEAIAVGTALLATLDADADAADGRQATVRAAACGNLGVAWSFVGDHDRSLAAYARAGEEYSALGNDVAVAQQRANAGIEMLALGRAREAGEILRQSHDAFSQAGDRLWTAKCAAHLADAYRQVGRLVDALALLGPAHRVLAELGAAAEEGRVHLAEANVCLAAGLTAEAVRSATIAGERARSAGMDHDAAFALFTRGLARAAAGNKDAAAQDLGDAHRLFVAVNDRQYAARVALARGVLAHDRASVDGAAAELQSGGWRVPLAWAGVHGATLADSPAEAVAALDAVAPMLDELGVPDLRHAHALALARVRRAQGRLQDAEELAVEAIAIAESAGASLTDPSMRLAFRNDRRAADDELVDLLAMRGAATAALHAADRAKARTLSDLVAGTIGLGHPACPQFDGTSDDGLARLRADLSATFAALVDADDVDHRRALRERAGRLEADIAATRRRAGSAPGAARLRSTPQADEDRRLTVAYHVVGDDLLIFVSCASEVHVHRAVGARPVVTTELARLVAQWNRFRLGSAFVGRHGAAMQAATQDILSRLDELLIAPVRPLLEEIGGDELVVVPHQLLHRVPFAALSHAGRPLLERWIVSLAPTTSNRPVAARSSSGSRGALVLAVPDARAPSIAAEAEALRAAVPDAVVLSDGEATAQALAAYAGSVDRIHLACHALYRPANPLFSAVRLADGWLTSADVLGLRLDDALVTLSACESGRPAEDSAEPVGLAWAFLAAGASAVVVSQWLVDDAVTTELMVRFARAVATGVSPAHALRTAQLATAIDHPHPYHWAAFGCVLSPFVPSPSVDVLGETG